MLEQIRVFGRNFLKGRLTYLVAWLSIAFAAYGWLMGYLDAVVAFEIINVNLAIVGIRRNMVNKGGVGRPVGT